MLTIEPGVDVSEGGFLPRDQDHPGGRGTALDPDRLGCGARRRAGRAGAAQPRYLGRGPRIGPRAQQGRGGGIEEYRRGGLEADADKLPAEDLGREQPVAAHADQPGARPPAAPPRRPVRLRRVACLGARVSPHTPSTRQKLPDVS